MGDQQVITSGHAPTSEVGEVDDGQCGVSTRVRRPPIVYTVEGEAITAFKSQDLGSSSPEVDDGRCGVSTRVRRPPMVLTYGEFRGVPTEIPLADNTGEVEAITQFESQDLGSSSPVCKSNPTPRCAEEPTGIRQLLRKCAHCISDWVDALE